MRGDDGSNNHRRVPSCDKIIHQNNTKHNSPLHVCTCGFHLKLIFPFYSRETTASTGRTTPSRTLPTRRTAPSVRLAKPAIPRDSQAPTCYARRATSASSARRTLYRTVRPGRGCARSGYARRAITARWELLTLLCVHRVRLPAENIEIRIEIQKRHGSRTSIATKHNDPSAKATAGIRCGLCNARSMHVPCLTPPTLTSA